MLKMLVVDDEIYALKGITQGIDWSDLPFSAILEADNVKAAMRIMESEKVDLVISDIEMPGANGMELLRWIHREHPGTLVVFLTGHARFEYAREALKLGCFDYALKPLDHDALKEIVAQAVKEIESRRTMLAFEETLDVYRRQWTSQLPILVERFWQDLLGGRLSLERGRLGRQLEQYGIPLRPDGRVLPALLSIEQWSVEMTAGDESIMEYAVRKAAAETIVGERPGTVLQDRELNLVLLYLPEGEEEPDRGGVLERCRDYVRACGEYFHCRISCYVGEPARIAELPGAIDRLVQAERSNVSASRAVFDVAACGSAEAGAGSGGGAGAGGNAGNGGVADSGGSAGASGVAVVGIDGVVGRGAGVGGVTGAGTGAAGLLPSFGDWGMLFDSGRQDEVLAQLEETLRRLEDEKTSRETLELLHYGFLHMLYQTAHRKGVSVYETLTAQELSDPQASRSPQQLLQWAGRLVEKTAKALQERHRDTSAVIAKIGAYIQDNLHRELSRDDIAAAVYRNPAYLSRLFRKETGLSLSEYIAQQKIERAKKQLAETNDKISNIAEGLGYAHFSYFAKLFRKLTGLTPQDYRKKHQVL